MPLADKPPRPDPRGKCGLAASGITPDELAIIDGWIGNHSDEAISERLAEEGYHVSGQVVGRHRLQRCRCYR